MGRVALLLVVSLLLSACSRTTDPASPPGNPSSLIGVAHVAATLMQAEVYHPAGPRVAADGKEPVLLTRYPIHVLLTFESGVDHQAVEKALQVDGPAPNIQRWEGDALYFYLPDDQPGPWQIRLPNVRFRDQTGFALEIRRVRENQARVVIAGKEMDSPPPPTPDQQTWDLSGTFARGLLLRPAEMQVRFAYPVRHESVEETVRSRLAETRPSTPVDLRFTWASDQEVTIIVPPDNRPVVINWTGARDAEGAVLWTPGYTLQFTGGRRLVAIDPASGKTELLHTLDLAFDAALLSPDRSRLALLQEPAEEGGRPVRVLDLATGAVTETGQKAWSLEQLRWAGPDRLDVQPTPAEPRHVKLSPDGRWLAEVTVDQSALAATPPGAPPRPVPAFLTVTDQQTGAVQRHRLHTAPAKYGSHLPALVWSNDSRRLAFYDAAAPAKQLYALEVETGQLRPLATTDRLPGNPWGPSGLAPDGLALAYQGLLIQGGRVKELGGATPYTYPWSPDSRFLLYTALDAEEGRLWLYDLARGEERVIGQGVLAGWLPDGRALVVEGAGFGGFAIPGE